MRERSMRHYKLRRHKGTANGNAFLRKEKSRAHWVSRKLRSLKALEVTVRFVYFLNLIL